MNSNKRKSLRVFLNASILIVLIVVDQMSKYLATLNLKDKEAISIIDKVFELRYLENRGAAFGMLQNQKYLFLVLVPYL